MRTVRQANGTAGELAAVGYLVGHGWRIIARNIRLAGVEVDIVGVDPGPPTAVVVVEVRSARTAKYGRPEETVDRAKVGRLYRAVAGLREAAVLPADLGSTSVRVDLVVVDVQGGDEKFRHIRGLAPP